MPRPMSLFAAATGLAIAVAGAAPADAAGTHAHAHPTENGTVEAPLDVVRPPTDLPPAAEAPASRTVTVTLDTVEVTGRLAEGAAYHYWTFNRKIPGPFVRVRVGDRVEVKLTNPADSGMKHNVDFHAVTGPGGGGVATEAAPGETRSLAFTALKPGLYVYHCAVPLAAQHIANGMYGLILVEPEGGLPPVDREFYVMQGEIYTKEAFGAKGKLNESLDKLLDEDPEYYVFNGAVGALTDNRALRAKVGETIRIYFGVGGPNKTSSFHVIGEIFDAAYELAALTSAPLADVQTITVPPGGAAVVDLTLEVPGEYVLVDHALSRVARGLVGKLIVDGPANPAIFDDRQPEVGG